MPVVLYETCLTAPENAAQTILRTCSTHPGYHHSGGRWHAIDPNGHSMIFDDDALPADILGIMPQYDFVRLKPDLNVARLCLVLSPH